jgi:prepilin-type N-terminal cleavage/methylation domain-containing protein
MKPHPQIRGFTLIELLVVIAIIGALVALLLPAVQSAREAARRSMCTNQLKQWSLAMLTYEDANKALPYVANWTSPGGKETTASAVAANPIRSWVVAIWPFIEQAELHDRWNFSKTHNDTGATPIGGMRNNRLSEQRPSVYYCPSDKPQAFLCRRGSTLGTNSGNCAARQNYVVNGGKTGLLQLSGRVAPFGFSAGSTGWNFVPFATKLSDITDGTSHTMLMGEMRVFPKDEGMNPANAAGVEWTSWADADPRGVAITATGGTPSFSAYATPNSGIDGIKGRCDYDPGLPCEAAVTSLEFRIMARSRHPGGVNVSMSDGTVRFIQNTIALAPWQEMATMNSGQPVGSF